MGNFYLPRFGFSSAAPTSRTVFRKWRVCPAERFLFRRTWGERQCVGKSNAIRGYPGHGTLDAKLTDPFLILRPPPSTGPS